tara:strand:+ start:512 stop:625 length:114 start_codon:yes stop_codon:yes gene_type:complete
MKGNFFERKIKTNPHCQKSGWVLGSFKASRLHGFFFL